MTATSTRKPRSDAQQNRARVLSVARRSFAAEGLDVTMREIARRSELGVATVYRHFPAREDLITAAFAEQVAACTASVAAALADPDPWRGLCAVMDEICGRQALDRGFNAALLGSTSTVFARERAQNMKAFTELTRRAHEAGVLRPGFTVQDLRLVIAATTGITAHTPQQTLIEVRRLATLLLQGMQAHPPSTSEPLPPR